MNPLIRTFFDTATNTATHIVHAGPGSACAIIDSVLDYDPKSGCTKTGSADAVIAAVRELELHVEWLLETHVHADHLSAAPYLKEKLGGTTGVGAGVTLVQSTFGALLNAPVAGQPFERLFADGERFRIGVLEAAVIATPGHTPACVCYRIGDAVFVGDTMFMPDYGTARCDFPGGDARTLFRSIRKILSLPEATRLLLCHDYGPDGRPFAWETTVGEQRRRNPHVKDGISEAEFVAMREARDAKLDVPVLLWPSVQVNMNAGHLPTPESNGTAYIKVPLNRI